jgi:hypothetical protein
MCIAEAAFSETRKRGVGVDFSSAITGETNGAVAIMRTIGNILILYVKTIMLKVDCKLREKKSKIHAPVKQICLKKGVIKVFKNI